MKKILSLFMVVLMCMSMVLPMYATDEIITPRYNNVAMATGDFTITSTGLAIASFTYTGYTEYATRATITCKIEKKTLWWWSDVDGASWIDELTGSSNFAEHTIQLSKKGKYKLTYEIVVYGTAGDPDVINSYVEQEY